MTRFDQKLNRDIRKNVLSFFEKFLSQITVHSSQEEIDNIRTQYGIDAVSALQDAALKQLVIDAFNKSPLVRAAVIEAIHANHMLIVNDPAYEEKEKA